LLYSLAGPRRRVPTPLLISRTYVQGRVQQLSFVSMLRRVVRAVLGVYMRQYHGLRLLGADNLPPRGPAIVLVNHASLLDVPALMVLDPYDNTILIAKASLFNVPGVSWLLREWGAIAVERQGRDSSGVRAVLRALQEGHVTAVA